MKTVPTQVNPAVPTQVNPADHHWDKPFWRSVVSSEFGVGSTSRMASMLIIVVSLGIVVYLVIVNRAIPEKLTELGFFSALLITTVYTPSKIAGIFKSVFPKR